MRFTLVIFCLLAGATSALAQSGVLHDALTSFDRAIALAPELAEAHGNRASRNLRQARNHHDVRRLHGSREPRGEGEWNGEPVGHTDHDVAHNFGGSEVVLGVVCYRHALFH